MYKILTSNKFEKSLKKYLKKNPDKKEELKKIFFDLSLDPFNYSMKPHKLSGKLKSLYSISCGYDCRILFSLEKIDNINFITLLDIGTHDNVY